MPSLKEQIKAVVGAVTTGLGALVTALADGEVTQLEWSVVAFAVVGAYGAVYGIRNQLGAATIRRAGLPAEVEAEVMRHLRKSP